MSPTTVHRRQQSERQRNSSAAATTRSASVMTNWRRVGRSGSRVHCLYFTHRI